MHGWPERSTSTHLRIHNITTAYWDYALIVMTTYPNQPVINQIIRKVMKLQAHIRYTHHRIYQFKSYAIPAATRDIPSCPAMVRVPVVLHHSLTNSHTPAAPRSIRNQKWSKLKRPSPIIQLYKPQRTPSDHHFIQKERPIKHQSTDNTSER